MTGRKSDALAGLLRVQCCPRRKRSVAPFRALFDFLPMFSAVSKGNRMSGLCRVALWPMAALGTLVTVALSASPALAVKQFKERFEKRYIKADSAEPKDAALREAYEKAGCNVCHEGESKKNRNVYGRALHEYLDKKDKDDDAKIDAALEKVESKRSVPGDEKSPTFGELLRQGKLPASE